MPNNIETSSLSKNMTLAQMVKSDDMVNAIKKSLPSMISPDRFVRSVLNTLNNNPELQKCEPMSFLNCILNASSLGLEPGPLSEVWFIPYKNKNGKTYASFQLGYKGLLTLLYRNPKVEAVSATCVYEHDIFEYEMGLEPKLKHIPGDPANRGNLTHVYAIIKMVSGHKEFFVMSKEQIDKYAQEYSKAYNSASSPWQNELGYEAMAKKVCIKQLLKYSNIQTEFQQAVAMDETVRTGSMDFGMNSAESFSVYNEEIPSEEPVKEPEFV